MATSRSLPNTIRALWKLDQRLTILAVIRCIELIRDELPLSDPRARLALDGAKEWIAGQTGEWRLRVVEAGASASFHQSRQETLDNRGWMAAVRSDAIGAVVACMDAIENIEDPTADSSLGAEYCQTAVGRVWSVLATARGHDVTGEEVRFVRAQRERDMVALVLNTAWPRTEVTLVHLRGQPPAVQVAWDALDPAAGAELTAADLLEAYQFAGSVVLRWDDPLQRRLAERTKDRDFVSKLLGWEPIEEWRVPFSDEQLARLRREPSEDDGGMIPVVMVAPTDYDPQQVRVLPDTIDGWASESEQDETWLVRFGMMTAEALEALPDFEGW